MEDKKRLLTLNDISTGALLRLLSESPLDLELVNDQGQSPLHLAVLGNRLEVAALLLQAGYDPNQRDNNLLSPFIAAAANGFTEMFELLLQFSPNLKQVNRFGGTALLPSSEKGFIRVVQLALTAGVPVDSINRLGWTALLEAVILGNQGFLYRDIVAELLEHGADPSLVDYAGKSARDYAPMLLEGETRGFADVKSDIRRNRFYQALVSLLKREESLEQIYYLAYTYEQLKQYEAAKAYYKKGLAADPQFAYYLANLAKKSGAVDEALGYFKLGATLDGSDFYPYHQSNYLRELGRHAEAVQLMADLLQKNPQRVDYMFHKANSLRTLGNHQEAHDMMVEASRIQPTNQLFQEHLNESQQLMERTEGD